MANKFYADSLTLTTSYQQITSADMVGRFEVSLDPDNTGQVNLLGSDGSTDVPLGDSWYREFSNVRLSDLQFKSTVGGDKVIVVGEQGRGA